MKRWLLSALLLLVSCSDPTTARPRKVRAGLCTVVYTYLVDRTNPSKGTITLTWRPPDSDSCPDEVRVLWDEDQAPAR